LTVGVSQLLCTGPKIFSGVLGFEAFVAGANIESSFGTAGISLQDNGFGFADISMGPLLALAPMIRNGRPVFSQRFVFSFNIPSGTFDSGKDFNQGSGYWSLNPYWAATWLPDPKWEVSWRLHYLYNFETSDIASSLVPPALFGTGQAGQAAWINFTASYALTGKLRLGLNGYYLKQFTNDELDGVSYSGGREESLYLGPGLRYEFDMQNGMNVNVYLPIEEKNRLSGGVQLNLMYFHVF